MVIARCLREQRYGLRFFTVTFQIFETTIKRQNDMNIKQVFTHTIVSIVVALAAIFAYHNFAGNKGLTIEPGDIVNYQSDQSGSFRLAHYDAVKEGSAVPVDFTFAASMSTPAVVHVKKFFTQDMSQANPWADMFGDDFYHFFGVPKQQQTPRRQQASGSGVIVSPDGYIVTNNHVVSNADEVEVTLFNNRTVKAQVIGADPSTDLALLKIDMDDLPYMYYGDSDSARVGEWVLAVGNPFDLTSTVTAGIISAKGRSINLLGRQSNTPIESFIQTDAAVNPGNSGGALVNTRGELIGINTAIATPTGTYAGYSFAVPVNIVKKVVEDMKEFGIVQRAFLGVSIRDIDDALAKEKELPKARGVYIAGVGENSGAAAAGLKEGDVITSINTTPVQSVAELQEQVSRYRPGDKVKVAYVREGKQRTEEIVLRNQMGTTEVVEKSTRDILTRLGVEFEDLTKAEREKLDIAGGVKVSDITSGRLRSQSNIRKGFIITKVDKAPVNTASDILKILEKKNEGEGVMLEGFYPESPRKTYYYAFGM
jgi:serine protease Do